MTEFNQGASRLQEAFSRGKAFIPFITCGDPDLETTKACIREMAAAGAGVIELGVPFSDPTAEGPVIQAASERALKAGVTPRAVLDMARDLREEGIQVPFVIMTYANVPFAFGADAFMEACAQCGIDGLILPDVPFEEKEEFQSRKRQIKDVCMKRKTWDTISFVIPFPRSSFLLPDIQIFGYSL